MASDLVLHCLSMSHKKYARLVWVKCASSEYSDDAARMYQDLMCCLESLFYIASTNVIFVVLLIRFRSNCFPLECRDAIMLALLSGGRRCQGLIQPFNAKPSTHFISF